MKKLIPPSADLQLVPAEDGIFFVTLGNKNRITPESLSIVREGGSFLLLESYGADGRLLSLEVTIEKIIPPSEPSRCTMLRLIECKSREVLGAVSIGHFVAAIPKRIRKSF